MNMLDKCCECNENGYYAAVQAYSINIEDKPKRYKIRLIVAGAQMEIDPLQWDALMRAIKLFESENMVY